MEQNKKMWEEVESLTKDYDKLGLVDMLDYNKFYIYSIITHSTAIEGSTLTEFDTQLLFDEGLTANGKPLVHHLMNEDLKNAYEFATAYADRETIISVAFLKQLNALVMHSTGAEQSMLGGDFDSSKGDYRLCGVTAGVGKSYMNYQKIPENIEILCKTLNSQNVTYLEDIYNLSFDAHLNLVTIHPWLDGNGRTSRLLMNYIQFCHNIIPCKIFKEDRAEYIASLNASSEGETNSPFREFMTKQLVKTLQEEIKAYKKNQKKGFTFMF